MREHEHGGPAENPSLPQGTLMPGSFEQFVATDVDEAMELAGLFKTAGRYEYFRGQRDASWALNSSFARADEATRLSANEKINDFIEWVRSAEDLVPYLPEEDMIIAAAQHHQVAPTTFIDFSLDPAVAAWFATDGAKMGDLGAIYMVHPDDVTRIFEALSRRGPILRFRRLDVPNLWRLQAQSGLFLEAQCDVERIWPFDRIVFPQTGAAPLIDRSRIYPEHRSHLEQAIDEYQLLRTRERNFREIMAGGVTFIEVEHPLEGRMPRLDRTDREDGWTSGPNERWVALEFIADPPIWSAEEILRDEASLQACVAERRACPDLLVIGSSESKDDSTQKALDRLWEGMRPHPYTAEQLTAAVQSLMRLCRLFEGYPPPAPEGAGDWLLETHFDEAAASSRFACDHHFRSRRRAHRQSGSSG